MLRKLVLSLTNSNLNKLLINRASIIIIDNDSSKTAESTVARLIEENKSEFDINYYSFPVKGLSNVRNELFRKALELNPDYILGIDDDEFVSDQWIDEFMSSIIDNNGDIVLGPVIPTFEKEISPYLSYWFKYPKISNAKQIKFFWTSSYIISAKFLLKHEIKFDMRFNSSGGEDSYFGICALNSGAKIFWAEHAVAYETNPEKRTNLRWIATRCFNGAANFTLFLKLEKRYFRLLKKILISIFYLICGFISLILLPLPVPWKYWGIMKLAESFGGFAGLFSFQLHEYDKER